MVEMGRVGVWSGLRSWDGARSVRRRPWSRRPGTAPSGSRRSGRRRARPLPRRARRHDRPRRGHGHPQHLASRRPRGRGRDGLAAGRQRRPVRPRAGREPRAADRRGVRRAAGQDAQLPRRARRHGPIAERARPCRPATTDARAGDVAVGRRPPLLRAARALRRRPRRRSGPGRSWPRADRRPRARQDRGKGTGPPVLRPLPAPAELHRQPPRLGYTDEDLAQPGSDRLVDAVVAWGSAAEHRGAGAGPPRRSARTTCACRSYGPTTVRPRSTSGGSWRARCPTEASGADRP